MYGYGYHMTGWGYALMTVTTLLLWGLLIVGIVALVRYLGHTRQRPQAVATRPTPRDLLAERFARGEIDAEQYQRDLEALGGRAAPGGSSRTARTG